MEILEALRAGHDALDEALTTHIYCEENGEKPEPDCGYVAARDQLKAAADSAETFGAFTYLEMEAALCVWECICEWLGGGDALEHDWSKLRDEVGTVEMRHGSMVLGRWCLKVYDLALADDTDFFDAVPYDWEVIPMILGHARNSYGNPTITESALPDPAIVVGKVKAQHLKNQWFEAARSEAFKQWAYADLIEDNAERAEQAYANGQSATEFVEWLGQKYGLTPAVQGYR